ncbi:hypothetical protein D3C79_1063390 [compost metagenome]
MVHRVEQGGVEERTTALPTAFVDDPCTLVDGIGHQAVEIIDLARFRQWRQRHPRLPWHAGFERGQLALEFLQEGIYHILMDEQHF